MTSFLSEKNVCGFKAIWALDKNIFTQKGRSYSTETKIVQGMPDVEWHLQGECNGSSIAFYMIVKSERKIRCIATLQNKTYESWVHCGGQSNQYLCRIDHREIKDSDCKNGKYEFKIRSATFRYKGKSNILPRIYNPCEWGLRLRQNSPEDFEIILDGETFMIHKMIVAAESSYFKRMFKSNFNEAKKNTVTIKECSVPVLKAFIDYCYGRDVGEKKSDDNNISSMGKTAASGSDISASGEDESSQGSDNANSLSNEDRSHSPDMSTFNENESDIIDLLYFSDMYICRTLKPQLETILASKISKENISLYVSTADKANALKLRQACIEFVRNLLSNNESFTAEEMEAFDMKFMKDVLAFNCYK